MENRCQLFPSWRGEYVEHTKVKLHGKWGWLQCGGLFDYRNKERQHADDRHVNQKITNPSEFKTSGGHCLILSFSLGARDDSLLLLLPGNQGMAQENTEASDWFASIGTSTPIIIAVGTELARGWRRQENSLGRSSPNVFENTMSSC